MARPRILTDEQCKHNASELQRSWREKNAVRHLQVKKRHYLKNKEKYNKYSSGYIKDYYSKDNPEYEKHREQKKKYNKRSNKHEYLKRWLIKIGLI